MLQYNDERTVVLRKLYFVLYDKSGQAVTIAAKYEKDRRVNKEDIALLAFAKCHVSS